jgi:hypothetical protein
VDEGRHARVSRVPSSRRGTATVSGDGDALISIYVPRPSRLDWSYAEGRFSIVGRGFSVQTAAGRGGSVSGPPNRTGVNSGGLGDRDGWADFDPGLYQRLRVDGMRWRLSVRPTGRPDRPQSRRGDSNP